MGNLFKDGKGVERSDDRAVELYRSALEHGHNSAVLSLIAMVEEGRADAPSDEELSEWYRKAIKASSGSSRDRYLGPLLRM